MSRGTDENKLVQLREDCPLVEISGEHRANGWTLKGTRNGATVIEVRRATLTNSIEVFKAAYSRAAASGLLR